MQIPLYLLPNPYEVNIWGCLEQLNKDMVTDCLRKGLFKSVPLLDDENHQNSWLHASRVAYFVYTGWKDLIYAAIQFTDQNEPYLWCQDGNHRVAAALYLDYDVIQSLFDETVDQFLSEKGL